MPGLGTGQGHRIGLSPLVKSGRGEAIHENLSTISEFPRLRQETGYRLSLSRLRERFTHGTGKFHRKFNTNPPALAGGANDFNALTRESDPESAFRIFTGPLAERVTLMAAATSCFHRYYSEFGLWPAQHQGPQALEAAVVSR